MPHREVACLQPCRHPLTAQHPALHPGAMPSSTTVAENPIALFDAENMQDPYPLYARLRAAGSVQRFGDSNFYAVCGWDAVQEAIARTDDFSSNLTATMVYHPDTDAVTEFQMAPLDDPSHALAVADDPAHLLHRKLLVPHLSAKRIRDIEEFATETADQTLSAALPAGQLEWMGAVANRLPMMVVARLIGVPDEDADRLIHWAFSATMLLDGIVSADQLQAAGLAAIELGGYVLEHFSRAAAEGAAPNNLLTDLAARCASGELEQVAAMGIMVTLFGAGGESTTSLLGSAVRILATQPEIQRRVRENPELLGAFIEETLRYEPPFRGHYRHVRRATSLAGVDLPADSRLLLLWGAANRDSAQFTNPDVFQLDRSTGKGHLSFGKGAHFCVGAALARLEARIVLSQLLERTKWIEPADGGQRWLPSMLVRRLQHLHVAVR